KIQSLPTDPVTEQHVGSRVECPVCKDDDALGEQLPCNHLFHDGCIVHLLEQYDSCPSSSLSSSSSSSPCNENATSNS
ncbi:hypothetical protein EGM_07747, partial [Macaca fascicularis]